MYVRLNTKTKIGNNQINAYYLFELKINIKILCYNLCVYSVGELTSDLHRSP